MKRSYIVMDKATAAENGVNTLTNGSMVNFALASVWLDNTDKIKVDTVVCWGYNRENLQRMADARNADMAAMRSVIEKTLLREDASDMPAGEPPADAPKKRGRPKKNVDTEAEAC